MILSYTHDICIVELIESHTIKFSYSTLLTQQRSLEGVDIPHICHFFTLAKFLENKIYTKKRQFFALNL